MSKKKKRSKTISDLYLDRPTSHGGWPDGHSGGYTDNKTPVNKQIAKFFQDMGLIDDDNPRARLSESVNVVLSEEHLKRFLSLKESGSFLRNQNLTNSIEPKNTNLKLNNFISDQFSYTLQMGKSRAFAIEAETKLADKLAKIFNEPYTNLSNSDIQVLSNNANIEAFNKALGASFESLLNTANSGLSVPFQEALFSKAKKNAESKSQGANNAYIAHSIKTIALSVLKKERDPLDSSLKAFDLTSTGAVTKGLEEQSKYLNKIPKSNSKEEYGLLGEYLAAHFSEDYSGYLNMNQTYSKDFKVGGLNPDQFPGVDLWLTNNDSFVKKDVEDGVLDFSSFGVFASVKTSQWGTSTGTGKQPPALDEIGQIKAAISIIGAWLLNSSFDPSISSTIQTDFNDVDEKYVKNHPVFKLAHKKGVDKVKIKFDAYNLSGISTNQVSSIFVEDEGKNYVAALTKKVEPVDFEIKITDNSYEVVQFTDISTASYNKNICYLVGDVVEYQTEYSQDSYPVNPDIKSTDNPVIGTAFDASRGSSGDTQITIDTRHLPGVGTAMFFTKEHINDLLPQVSNLLMQIKNNIAIIQSQGYTPSSLVQATSNSSFLHRYAQTSTEALAAYDALESILIKSISNSVVDLTTYQTQETLPPSYEEIEAHDDAYKSGRKQLEDEIKQEREKLVQLYDNNENVKEAFELIEGANIDTIEGIRSFSNSSDDEDVLATFLDDNQVLGAFDIASSIIEKHDELVNYPEYQPLPAGDHIVYSFFENLINKFSNASSNLEEDIKSLIKNEIRISLLFFRLVLPKPPGINASQLSTLTRRAALVNENANIQVDINTHINKIISRLNTISDLLSSVIGDEESTTFGNEPPSPGNLNTNDETYKGSRIKSIALSQKIKNQQPKNFEKYSELTAESKIYKQVIHKIMIESFYKSRGRK